MNWKLLLLLALLVYFGIRVEAWIRSKLEIRAWKKARAARPLPDKPRPNLVGFTQGAAHAHKCECCKLLTHNFYQFDEGYVLCPSCHEEGKL